MTAPVETTQPAIKPGILTSELWLTVLTHVAWVIAFVFHRDFSSYVPAAAVGAAAVATLVYAIGRAHLKLPRTKADVILDEQRLAPVLGPLMAEVRGAVAAVEAALPHKTQDALAAKPSPAKKTAAR